MKKVFSIQFCLIFILVCLAISFNSFGGHAEWHEGPSCGACHCEKGQVCKVANETCMCLNEFGESD
jgi:hypothetical protein